MKAEKTFDEITKMFWTDYPEEYKKVIQELIEMGMVTEEEIIRKQSNFFDIYNIKEKG